MKFRFHGLAALLAAACLTSCFGIDNQLGEDYIATNQKYNLYTAEFNLDDIEMACPDSLSGYSTYRFTVGAIRDEQFGLTTRSAAFTLVPILDTLDFGKNATFKSFHFTAPYDSVSCEDLSQAHILQNINVYALEKELDMKAHAPKIVHSENRISLGVPVFTGSDSLSFNFNKEFGERYMQITQADLDDIETYRKNFPGIYITTDAPAGNGGRINMFKVPLDVASGSIYGSYAVLKFKADYGTRTQVDTSFYFYIGPVEKYDMSSVTSTSATDYPQIAYDLAVHESKEKMEGKATDKIWFEGGRGLKPVVKAQSIKDKLSAIVAQYGDVSEIIVSKATIEMPFEFPENYEDMRLYPTTLSPTCRIVTDTSITFAGITDASVSTENQGTINRSTLMYAPDLSHHVQSILRLKDTEKIENYDIWFLAMADEVVTTTSTSNSNSEMADYYQQMAYASYYNSMYGGYGGYGYGDYGYGGYGSYGYGSNYYNYYNYMMLANMYSSSGSTVSTQSMMDFHRYYRAVLNGPDSDNAPRLRVTFAVPAKE